MVAKREIDNKALQHEPVLLTLPTRHLRVRLPSDHVHDVRVTLNDERKRLDRRLETLSRRKQTEGRQHQPRLDTPVPARCRRDVEGTPRGRAAIPPASEHDRRTMGNDTDLLHSRRARIDEETPRRLSHNDHTFRLAAECRQYTQLVRRWLRQDRVQGHDERLRQLLRERQDILAVRAAEDPELVLEQNNVDVEPAEQPGSANIVETLLLQVRR
jgi:hypothetical protein